MVSVNWDQGFETAKAEHNERRNPDKHSGFTAANNSDYTRNLRRSLTTMFHIMDTLDIKGCIINEREGARQYNLQQTLTV